MGELGSVYAPYGGSVTRVVHLRQERYDVGVGRPSPWGNPFTDRHSRVASVTVTNRQVAIENHIRWFAHDPAARPLHLRLHQLFGRTIGCWCKPLECHGDALAMFTDAFYRSPMSDIIGFRGPYAFLSNFWPCEIWLDDMKYPTLEHAYQAAKSVFPDYRRMIQQCSSPGRAKACAAKVGSDWHEIKVQIMDDLLRQKFMADDNRHFYGRMLLNTGFRELVEDNWWGDTFWGVCRGVGDNTLGILLMAIRVGLRADKPFRPVILGSPKGLV